MSTRQIFNFFLVGIAGVLLVFACSDDNTAEDIGATTDADADGDSDTDIDTDTDADGDVNDTDTVEGDGYMCSYDGEPHVCECADGVDNDSDDSADANDLHCFGPWDDDESSYATGIPGDNNGAMGSVECPFDGNSGTGNDLECCYDEMSPGTNIIPNGCDNHGCCEVDLNGNGSGEFVYVSGTCDFAPVCGAEGTHGCACSSEEECDAGQSCLADKNTGAGFCSTCVDCQSDIECANPCDCGEICFGGFERPPEECGTGDVDTDLDSDICPDNLAACGTSEDCNVAEYEDCISGCCYGQCPDTIVPCKTSVDCPDELVCLTGCCYASIIIE